MSRPSVIPALVRKELLGHLLTLRLAVAFGVTVGLVALVAFIGSLDHSTRMAEHRASLEERDAGLEAATVWFQVQPHVRLPPQPLAVFALGAEAWVENNVSVAVWLSYEAPHVRANLANDFLKSLVPVDVVTVVAVVLSFLAVALGFDGISGEREAGTLGQLLAQPVRRAHVILAKILGGCLALWISLSVAFGLACAILAANPDWSLGAGDGWRLAAIFPLSCLFLAQVYSASLLVSCLVERSATSLILCLFGWLLGGVVWMNMAPFVGEFAMRETPWQSYVDQATERWQQYNDDIADWEARHPSPGQAYTEGLTVDDGVLRFVHPEGLEWLERRSRFRVAAMKERTDDITAMRWHNMHDERAEQAMFADRWSPLSPWDNYRVLTYLLARTTMADKLHLATQVRQYRESFVQWLRGRDAFGRRWFCDDPPHQRPMIDDPAAVTASMMQPGAPFLRERLAWARAENERIDPSSRHLDLTGLPRFDAASGYPSLAESLTAMLPGLAVLILSLAGVVMAAVLRFQTYEPHR
jgi:ABC-type transport system involved in multi-copper enzyme maturation permease subunit